MVLLAFSNIIAMCPWVVAECLSLAVCSRIQSSTGTIVIHFVILAICLADFHCKADPFLFHFVVI